MAGVLLLAVAGFLLGGAWSVWRQSGQASAKVLSAALGACGAVAATAGVLWLV